MLIGSFFATVILTGWVRNYALAKKIMDIPNERSSHSQPTPRGGGVAIVSATLLTVGLMWLDGMAGGIKIGAYAVGGFLVAAVGYMDDNLNVSALWRLIVHFAAALLVVGAVGKLPPFSIMGFVIGPSGLISILASVFIVWILNLYNFMDGIDGIAAVEAVTVAGAAALLLRHAGAIEFAMLAAVLATVSLGFVVWNWPPAKIFMGDVGSGFLGFCFGTLVVMTCSASVLSPWTWLILLGVFLVDSTVTLIRRMFRLEKFYEAHRSHAYQYASRVFGGHLPITMAVGLINLLWLFPIAFLVVSRRLDGLLGLIIAYTPLLALTLYFRAGARESQNP
jgi:Fuc2NAc and GlcNAc transferase